ncbi:MAG TPA: hypothetical protein VF516_31535 [Kofleriaceae bacterium]
MSRSAASTAIAQTRTTAASAAGPFAADACTYTACAGAPGTAYTAAGP